MFQSVLLILLIIGAFWVFAHIKRQPPAQQRKLILRSALGAVVIVLLMMVITGRMHWLFALIGALLPFARGLLGMGLQVLPLWLRRKQSQTSQTQHENSHSKKSQRDMDIREALDVLGLEGDIAQGEISVQMINDAHRRLIQKLHPDRGGSDYLAAKINQARDLLLTLAEK